jgi:hypothetical protein
MTYNQVGRPIYKIDDNGNKQDILTKITTLKLASSLWSWIRYIQQIS